VSKLERPVVGGRQTAAEETLVRRTALSQHCTYWTSSVTVTTISYQYTN